MVMGDGINDALALGFCAAWGRCCDPGELDMATVAKAVRVVIWLRVLAADG
jgi:hypothetical protein